MITVSIFQCCIVNSIYETCFICEDTVALYIMLSEGNFCQEDTHTIIYNCTY